jgi:TP53 regulating kinase-like protein
MAAVAAHVDDSVAGPGWTLLSQGAEARVYTLTACGVPAVAKHRFRKSYRIEPIDARLRKERTVAEARCLARCAEVGVRAPALLVADTARHVLVMERVDGVTAKRCIDDGDGDAARAVLGAFGAAIAALHDAGLTHGDLTTSNAMRARDGGVVLIDFGLGAAKATAEDKAVDLYVLERALASTHADPDALLAAVLDAYGAASDHAKAVLKRLDAVRARGRKRECFG